MWQLLHIASNIWCVHKLVFFMSFGVSSSSKLERERKNNLFSKAKWIDKTWHFAFYYERTGINLSVILCDYWPPYIPMSTLIKWEKIKISLRNLIFLRYLRHKTLFHFCTYLFSMSILKWYFYYILNSYMPLNFFLEFLYRWSFCLFILKYPTVNTSLFSLVIYM